MSADNFGALGADFFIKTFNKGSLMSQSDLDQLIQYVQLTTTILAIGEFTPGVQQSVWMILERVDVPSAPGYTVTNNTDVTMTSGGMVSIDSMPWSKVTGKPTLFTANQSLNTSDSVSFNRLTVTGASGIEGGEIQLAKAPNSTIAGDVVIDVYENKLRFFEGGGNGRGFYLDLTTGANNTSTNIMSGGDSFSGSYNDLTDKPSIPADVSNLTDTTGLLAGDGGWVPGNDIVQSAEDDLKIAVLDPSEDSVTLALVVEDGDGNVRSGIEIEYDRIKIETDNGDYQWRFEDNGEFRIPGNINTYDTDIDIIAMSAGSAGDITIKTVGHINDTQYCQVQLTQQNVSITTDMNNTPGGKTWSFDNNGAATLPAGGTITEGGGLTGAIRLTPAGGGNEYQALVIYPTENGEGDHVHLTAGGGTTELYLGNDSHYVKLVNGGNIEIKATATDNSASAAWLFDQLGDLTAPGDIILDKLVTTVTQSVTGTIADSNANPFTFRILKSANPQLVIPFADPNFVLKWTAGDAGSLAAAAQAPNGHGVSSLVSDDGTYWNFNSWYGLGGNRPNAGTVFTVEYGLVLNDTTISTTATNLVIEADAKQYKFGTNGNLTLPAGGDIKDSTGAKAFVSLSTLKQVVAASTDFADFQTRIANMQ